MYKMYVDTRMEKVAEVIRGERGGWRKGCTEMAIYDGKMEEDTEMEEDGG
jgi:hypothetical protein